MIYVKKMAVAYLYLYLPDDHDSDHYLDLLRQSGLHIITPILIDDEKTIQHLQHNSSGYSITELPCFIIRQKGQSPRIFSYHDYQAVFKLAANDYI